MLVGILTPVVTVLAHVSVPCQLLDGKDALIMRTGHGNVIVPASEDNTRQLLQTIRKTYRFSTLLVSVTSAGQIYYG